MQFRISSRQLSFLLVLAISTLVLRVPARMLRADQLNKAPPVQDEPEQSADERERTVNAGTNPSAETDASQSESADSELGLPKLPVLPLPNLQVPDINVPKLNIPLKTGGGTQLWTDHCFRDGFRIQQQAFTGHWRLLDANDVRRGWGSRQHCEELLDDLAPRPAATEQAPHYFVLLHGLMRTHHSMKALDDELRKRGHSHVIRFSYASTRRSISDHSAALTEVLEDLPDNAKFTFVGHSMGNIVVRHAVGRLQREGDSKKLLPRCRSMVMLGPPNQGAAIARRLAPTGLYGLVTGKGGLELGPQWETFVNELATPPFPFMIIAGDISDAPLQNPLTDGAGDFVVSLDEAKLKGAEAIETVPVLHSFIMSDPTAIEKTIEFVETHP